MALEVGRVCMKVVGREAGKLCIVLKNIANEKSKSKISSFVMVTGPKVLTGVKRRKANVNHLEPTKYNVEIKEDATDEDVYQAWEKSKLIKKFDLKKPSAAEMKSEKSKKETKTEKSQTKSE